MVGVLAKPRMLLFVAAALLFVTHPTASGQQSDEALPFVTIVKYVFGGPLDEDTSIVYVVTDRREWKKVWKLAHLTFPARPPIPEIDFSSKILLAVFHGFTGGQCTTSITGVVKTEEGLKIQVKVTCPGPTCGPQPANVLKPVEIVAIDRVSKSIRKKDPELIEELQLIECKPPN